MHTAASGLSAVVNTAINSQFYGGLIVAAVVALGGWFSRSLFRQWRRLGWRVLYDAPINLGDSALQDMWEIVYQEGGSTSQHRVKNGSLMVMEMRNIGRVTIRESDFDQSQYFRLKFPDRKVVHYKVRDNPWYHDRVHADSSKVPEPNSDNSFNLPALQMNPNDWFKLLILLEAATDPRPATYAKPVIEGSIQGGKFVEFGRRRHRRYGAVALAVLILLLGGAYAGDKIATGAMALAPACARGHLTIAGSTAFAPVLTQVATEYEQHCPGVNISINPNGSIKGFGQLKSGHADIAMFDGTSAEAAGQNYHGTPVGDIIFAIVGNRSQPEDRSYFTQGLSDSDIRNLFENPDASQHVLVGRSSVSGTRATFAREFLQKNDSSENNAKQCPAHPVPGILCLEPTTLRLLSTVNETPDSIGYAEADALPFFPSVGQVPVDGHLPTRDNVLAGNYSFLATEHLYTNGAPSGLAAAFINFLTSSPVTTQLRATTSFISCADLAGTKRGGDCAG